MFYIGSSAKHFVTLFFSALQVVFNVRISSWSWPVLGCSLLSCADLYCADLYWADRRRAIFYWTVLCCPVLCWADLSWVVLFSVVMISDGLFSSGKKSLWHSCTNRPFAGESVWQNLVFGPENIVLRSFIFSCNTGRKQPLLSLCSTHSVIPHFSSFSALSLTYTNMVPPFLLLFAASSPARQITIQRPAVPPKSVVTDSHYIVYLCESGGRHTLTIFKSGATPSPP